MEQRDLLKQQIEQLGKVLANLLARFIKETDAGNASTAIERTNEQFKSELDLDINKMVSLSKKELLSYFKERRFTATHLEQLSQYLGEIGKIKMTTETDQASICIQKAIEILDLADELSNSISFERMELKRQFSIYL